MSAFIVHCTYCQMTTAPSTTAHPADTLRGIDFNIPLLEDPTPFHLPLDKEFVAKHPERDYLVCSISPTGRRIATNAVLTIVQAADHALHDVHIGRCKSAVIARGQKSRDDFINGREVDTIDLVWQRTYTLPVLRP